MDPDTIMSAVMGDRHDPYGAVCLLDTLPSWGSSNSIWGSLKVYGVVDKFFVLRIGGVSVPKPPWNRYSLTTESLRDSVGIVRSRNLPLPYNFLHG